MADRIPDEILAEIVEIARGCGDMHGRLSAHHLLNKGAEAIFGCTPEKYRPADRDADPGAISAQSRTPSGGVWRYQVKARKNGLAAGDRWRPKKR